MVSLKQITGDDRPDATGDAGNRERGHLAPLALGVPEAMERHVALDGDYRTNL
jgi:hypothetical protein